MTTIELIKTLREQTGAGMSDCKKAIEACDGDLERASDWLREKGISKAAKKADRIAAEGLSGCLIEGNTAVVVEVNSETDFAAKNDMFKGLVQDILKALVVAKPATLEEALNCKVASGYTVNEAIINATSVIGEKLSLRRFVVLTKTDADSFGSYVHFNNKDTALVVVENCKDAEVANDCAMQVVGLSATYISKDHIPADIIARETAVQTEIAHNDPKLAGKPEAALANIIQGKVNKVFSEVCLLNQALIKDPTLTVERYVANHGGKVTQMVRFTVGEGMQKREENFAEEVAKQMKQ